MLWVILICTDLFQAATSGVSVISSISFDVLPAFVISIIAVVSFAADFYCSTFESCSLLLSNVESFSSLLLLLVIFCLWLDAYVLYIPN
jgi:hypothetical protein